jgi:membrane-associated protease RseP (regulator of RpoE activity)
MHSASISLGFATTLALLSPTTAIAGAQALDTPTITLAVDATGSPLIDVIPGSPAAQASLAPGMKLIAVNGRRYSDDLLRIALKESITATAPLEIIAENREFITTHRPDYHGGERFPRLERDSSKPDLLTPILSPRVPSPASGIPHNAPSPK